MAYMYNLVAVVPVCIDGQIMDTDDAVENENGKVRTFRSIEAARKFAIECFGPSWVSRLRVIHSRVI